MCRTKDVWDKAYSEAKSQLITFPRKLEILNNIYINPNYYAVYVTSNIVANLNLNGTVSAEQNHASIVKHNGQQMLGLVCNHLKSLVERQQNISNKENAYETEFLIKSYRYQPSLDGDMAFKELCAVKVLGSKPLDN